MPLITLCRIWLLIHGLTSMAFKLKLNLWHVWVITFHCFILMKVLLHCFKEYEYIFAFNIIPAGCWNPFTRKEELPQFTSSIWWLLMSWKWAPCMPYLILWIITYKKDKILSMEGGLVAKPLIFYHMCTDFQTILNSLGLRQNGRLFADDTFKHIFVNENIRISTKNSLKFVPKGLINNIPALVLIMAWRRSGDKPSSEPMLVRSLTQICVTRPQWVNGL